MPVVTCPKCPTKLRVPDGATGKVKCPKCATLFPVSTPAPSAAFEVVEDEPPASPPPPAKSAARPKAATPTPLPLPPPPPGENQFAFDGKAKPKKKTPAADTSDPARKKSLWEGADKRKDDEEDDDDGRPRTKRRRDEDEDDEDDRPRKKRRRDEDDDDDDDRPRSKRRRYDDDDDDDDRPRKKRRRNDDDDDDEDDDWHRPPKKKGPAGFAAAKTGVLLLNISFWFYLISLGLISFMIFLGWVGAFDRSTSSTTTTVTRTSGGVRTTTSDVGSNNTAELLVKLPGILGITNWILAGVGFGFCIAGPKQSRGMAITAASLAGAHLLLAGISIDNVGGMVGRFSSGASSGTWLLWATTLPILDTLLPVIIVGDTKYIGSDYIFALLAGGCELARLIFALLMVKAMARAAKDYDAEEKAQMGLMAAGAITGATVAIGVLLAVLAKAEAIKGFNVIIGSVLLVYVGFTAMTLLPILATNVLRRTLARKAR